MEVNDAIEFIEDSYTYLYVDLHGNKEEVKKFGEIVDLLKSLESENKKLKEENRKLFLDNAELNKTKSNLINRITTLEAENEAYEGIVEEIENDFGNGILQNENGFGVKLEHLIEIKKQKFFGGGE